MTECLFADPADTMRQLVDMANANDTIMDGTMRPVLGLIAVHDVVVGLWQDTAAPGGVDALIVKGVHWLREIAAAGDARLCAIADAGDGQQPKITALACTGPGQAEALRLYADADRAH